MRIISLYDKKLMTAITIVQKFPKSRWFAKDLDSFIRSQPAPNVCILYGVRRTGKTTAMLQCIARLSDSEKAKVVFFQVRRPREKDGRVVSGDSLWDLKSDMEEFLEQGRGYFFVDEATNLLDFQEGAEVLSDVVALQGAKIVLSGTDSLCLDDARRDALLGRAITINTTSISFSEWSLLTDHQDIDEFARHGGILGDGNQIQALFGNSDSCTEYVQSSYARNMEHSISERKRSNVPESIIELAEERRFEGAVQRVVEDLSHRVTLRALRRELSLSVIGSLRDLAAKDMRKSVAKPSQSAEGVMNRGRAMESIDEQQLIQWMALCLRIRDERELQRGRTVDGYLPLSETVVGYLHCELARLHVLTPFPVLRVQHNGKVFTESRNLLVQHGLKYCQAMTMAECLVRDPAFVALSNIDQGILLERLKSDVLGHVLEEIVLLEVQNSIKRKNKNLFACTLGLPSGEIDFVVHDMSKKNLSLFEIKHSPNFDSENQAKHLRDEEKLKLVCSTFPYSVIVRRTILLDNQMLKPFVDNAGISCMDIGMFLRFLDCNPYSVIFDDVSSFL